MMTEMPNAVAVVVHRRSGHSFSGLHSVSYQRGPGRDLREHGISDNVQGGVRCIASEVLPAVLAIEDEITITVNNDETVRRIVALDEDQTGATVMIGYGERFTA